jgi:hypothetical protein
MLNKNEPDIECQARQNLHLFLLYAERNDQFDPEYIFYTIDLFRLTAVQVVAIVVGHYS